MMLKGDWYRLLAIICGLGGAMLAASSPFLWSRGSELRKEELDTMKGEIKPPTLDFSKPFEIQFGGMHSINTIDELTKGINFSRAFNIGYDYPFKIEFKNEILFVSADIIDENLGTIATIENNEWTVNENDIIARDRNYNDYAFEVVDAHLRPRLQVIVKEQNKIYIGGFFNTDRGAIVAYNNTTRWGSEPEEIEKYIQKIFVYPSTKHLHEMIKPDS